MKMSEADLIWTPAKPYTADCPNPGAIRVERHGSGWERTSGDRWMPIHRSLVLGVFQQFETKDDRTRQLLSMFVLFNTVVVRPLTRLPAPLRFYENLRPTSLGRSIRSCCGETVQEAPWSAGP